MLNLCDERSRDRRFSDLHAAVEGSVDFCSNAHHLSHPKTVRMEDLDEEQEEEDDGCSREAVTLPVT